MMTTEILELLRRHPASYIERDGGTYQIKNAVGDSLTDFQPSYQQIYDLEFHFRIVKDGPKRHVLYPQCFFCAGPADKYLGGYEVHTCHTCFRTNHDGWAPRLSERLKSNLQKNGRPIPEVNKDGCLPREANDQ